MCLLIDTHTVQSLKSRNEIWDVHTHTHGHTITLLLLERQRRRNEWMTQVWLPSKVNCIFASINVVWYIQFSYAMHSPPIEKLEWEMQSKTIFHRRRHVKNAEQIVFGQRLLPFPIFMFSFLNWNRKACVVRLSYYNYMYQCPISQTESKESKNCVFFLFSFASISFRFSIVGCGRHD